MGQNPDEDPTNMGLNPDADPTNMGLNPGLELLIQTLRSEYRSSDVTIFIFIVYKSWAGGWSDKIIVRFIA